MVCRVETETGGTWRKGEFVQWTDLFAFVEGMLVWLGLLVVFMAMMIGALAVNNPDQAALTAYLSKLFHSTTFHFALTVSIYLVLLFFFWRIARRTADGALAARFRAVPAATFLLSMLAGMVLAVLVPLTITYLVQHNAIELKPTDKELRMVPQNVVEWLAALAAVGVMAPLTEELYFRGVLLGWLKHKMPVAAAVAINAVIFGLVHFAYLEHPGVGGWLVTGIIGSVGLLAAILAVRTRSLWPSVAVHSGYNAVLISLPLLQMLQR